MVTSKPTAPLSSNRGVPWKMKDWEMTINNHLNEFYFEMRGKLGRIIESDERRKDLRGNGWWDYCIINRTCDGEWVLDVFNVNADECKHVFVFLSAKDGLGVQILKAGKGGLDMQLYLGGEEIRKWGGDYYVAGETDGLFIWKLIKWKTLVSTLFKMGRNWG